MTNRIWQCYLAVLVWLVGSVYAFYRGSVDDVVLPGASPDGPSAHARNDTGRVVILFIDALRSDVAFDAEVMPHLNGLKERGVFGEHRTGTFPVSASFLKQFLSGRPANLWEVYTDLSAMQRSVPSWIADSGRRVAFAGPASAAGWLGAAPAERRVWTLTHMKHTAEHDRGTAAAGIEWLRAPHAGSAGTDIGGGTGQPCHIVFLHFAGLDSTGHLHGAAGPEYRDQARTIDGYLGQLVEQITSNDTVVVVSDHGMEDDGGHSHGDGGIVSWPPFVLCGPMIASRAEPLRISQASWPFLMACVLGTLPPQGYPGPPLVTPFADPRHPAVTRVLAWQAAQLGIGQSSLVDRDAPERLAASVVGRLQALQPRDVVWRRVAWHGAIPVAAFLVAGWATTSLRRVTPCLPAPPYGWLTVAGVAVLSGVLYTIEWMAGRVSSGQAQWLVDQVPAFRVEAMRRAPWAALAGFAALAACGVGWGRLSGKWRARLASGAVIVFVAGVSLARRRTDVLLWATVAVVSALVADALARRDHARLRDVLGGLALLAALAIGQKLRFEVPPGSAGYRTLQAAALGLAGLLASIVAMRSHWPAAVLLTLAAAARMQESAELARWGYGAVAAVMAVEWWRGGWDREAAAAGLASLCLLLLPAALQVPLLGAICARAMRGGDACIRPVAPNGVQASAVWGWTGAGVVLTHAIFFYGDGRDTYLPINGFFVQGLGSQAACDTEFALGWAIAVVLLRYALAPLVAWWLIHGCVGERLREPVAAMLLVYWLLRVSVTTTSLAFFGTDGFGYHLALLVNDAAQLVGSALAYFAMQTTARPRIIGRYDLVRRWDTRF
jgi:hypothetical protein